METTLTKRQVKKLMQQHGITGELTGRGLNWRVELADEKTMREFCKKVCDVGGTCNGHGAWALSPGYEDKGDWNDRSSKWHY